MMSALGILTWDVSGLERLRGEGVLVLANHPTLLDVVFLVAFIPNADCIVKSKLMNNPAMRGFVSLTGYITNGDGLNLVSQMKKYRQEGFPEHFGHVISGIIFRRHNEQDCIDVMKTWWEEIKYHSHLCQLSLGYSFWKNNFKWNWLPGDIRSFPDIVHQGPHTSKIVTADIINKSKKDSLLVDKVNGLNKIEIPKEEFAILGSGLLSLMGIQENKNLDIYFEKKSLDELK